jgi:hypothetical protein
LDSNPICSPVYIVPEQKLTSQLGRFDPSTVLPLER